MEPPVSDQPQTSPGMGAFVFTNDHVPAPVTANSPSPLSPLPQKKFPKNILVICLLVLLLAGIGTLLGITYGAIPLSNPTLQNEIADTMMTLPLLPKSPRYVLKSAILAHQKVTRFTLDASFAADIGDTSSVLPLGNLDMHISGPIDYTDPENPTADLQAQITKDFDVNLMAKDYKTYFKINQIPSFLSAFLIELGMTDDVQQQFIQKWFYVDTKPLQTEARANLNATQQKKSATSQAIADVFDALNDPTVNQYLSMNSETLEGMAVYHVHFQPTPKVLDVFWQKYTHSSYPVDTSSYNSLQKMSDVVDNFVLDVWIDHQKNLIQKTAVSFLYKPYGTSLTPGSISSMSGVLPTQKNVPVSFVIKMSKHGEPVTVTPPRNAIKFDDFFKNLTIAEATKSAQSNAGLNPSRQFAEARNNERRSDINQLVNALSLYANDHKGSYPPGISTTPKNIGSTGVNLCLYLVPSYIALLPTDPTLNTTSSGISASMCAKTYTTGFTVQKIGTKITITAPLAELGEKISVTR